MHKNIETILDTMIQPYEFSYTFPVRIHQNLQKK